MSHQIKLTLSAWSIAFWKKIQPYLLWDWLYLCLVGAAAFCMWNILTKMLNVWFLSRKEKARSNHSFSHIFPSSFTILVLFFFVKLWKGHLPEAARYYLYWILKLLFSVQLWVVVYRVINFVLHIVGKRLHVQYNQLGFLHILRSLTQIAGLLGTLYFISIFLGLPYLRHVCGYLSLGTGALSAVVALASKDFISNFFGALVLLTSKPFRVGDWIVVNNLSGRVIDISLRMTRLKSLQGMTISIPNSVFTVKEIQNYGEGHHYKLPIKVICKKQSKLTLNPFLDDLGQLIQSDKALIACSSSFELLNFHPYQVSLALHLSLPVTSIHSAAGCLQEFLIKMQDLAVRHDLDLVF